MTSRIIHFLVSLVELCRLIKEVSLAKIVFYTLLNKSFPLLLPSHNCINNYNVQFSRYIFESLKRLNENSNSFESSVNLFGGECRNRTGDLLLAEQALSQLS